MQIRLLKCTDGIIAFIKEQPDIRGYGDTSSDAIRDMVVCNRIFGITHVFQEEVRGCSLAKIQTAEQPGGVLLRKPTKKP